MRAVIVERFGGPEVLKVAQVPDPTPQAGQVRIAVRASAVNPVDAATRAGLLADAGLHRPAVMRLGWDVAGVVDAVGESVTRLRGGQEVLGMSDRLCAPSKAQADFIVLDEASVAALPQGSDPVEASTLPLAGLTAEQALDALDLRSGASVLVTGAGGAVGALACQLARLRGLRVIATARERHHDRVKANGTDSFIEAGDDLANRIRHEVAGGVDGVLDTADLGPVALDVVRPGGAYVGLVVNRRPAPLRGVRSSSLAVRGDWRQLTVLATLAATGALQLPETHTLALEDVRSAHEELERGGRDHRLVLTT